MEKNIIFLKKEPIKLGQLLKLIGIIDSGSDVKIFLSQNDVYINDLLDVRRGRKIYFNDTVKIDKEIFHIKESRSEDE